MNKHKLGFALGSGGSRGIAHIGFLQAMEEAGIVPDYITGCSMGAVVGAAYASGKSPEEMRKIVMKIRPSDLIELTPKKGGLFNPARISKLFCKHIGDVTFDQLKIPFQCVAVDMVSQKVVRLSSGKVVDAVVASSSIPAFFRPSLKDEMILVDGGVLERVPVRELKDMGAEKIVAVDVLGRQNLLKENPNMVNVLVHIVGITDNFIVEKYKKANRRIIDLWIEPDLGTMNQYAFKNFGFAYKQGYALGQQYAEQIRALSQAD
ncbi:MAG: patatin-like phospholipase family protein [Corallococcus sp.]|nr:patatin-like phospholipase family protein [Corallococcus sp.]MCM1359945.1 patatin-like phospholipase family protein [Corallococcus sp.]MCM1395501.1 patatin-like phospholipase family protein [Corallococcus sp.]